MVSAAATPILAGCVLSVLAFALVLYAWNVRRRFPLTLAQLFWYSTNYALARVLWRAQTSGPVPVPPDQGAVIISNHRSPVDSHFIEIATRRVVHWMVAREFYQHWAMHWFFRMAEAIPVNRGGIDTAATKTAIRYAKAGGLVGIFPEGKINTAERLLLPGRLGAAMIALRAQVPVVPCYIQGAPCPGSIYACFFTPAKVVVRFGQPLDLSEYYGREDDREVLGRLTRRFLAEIAALAGETDFQPELAGRCHQPGSVAAEAASAR